MRAQAGFICSDVALVTPAYLPLVKLLLVSRVSARYISGASRGCHQQTDVTVVSRDLIHVTRACVRQMGAPDRYLYSVMASLYGC